jgi:hypothetical protein
MRNRNVIFRRIEQIETKLKTLEFLVKRGGDTNTFLQEISNTEDILGDLKSIIEREPMSPDEINVIQ